MKIVRVTKGGWGHRFYVFPVSLQEKAALYLRGYREIGGTCALKRCWVNNKYTFDYGDGYHWINEGVHVRHVKKCAPINA